MKRIIPFLIILCCPSFLVAQEHFNLNGFTNGISAGKTGNKATPKSDCLTIDPWPEVAFYTDMYTTTGVAHDGTNVWVAGFTEQRIDKYSAETGEFIGSLPIEVEWINNITFVRGSLWLSDPYDFRIVEIDTSDGSIISTLPAPGPWPMGLDWDGSYFWHNDVFEGITYKLDTLGNVISSFPSVVGNEMDAISWTGQHLWIFGQYSAFKVDTTSFEILECFDMPHGPHLVGSAFDGQNLWISSNEFDLVYSIDISHLQTLDNRNTFDPELDFQIFPNPFFSEFRIEDPYLEIVEIQMYDALGISQEIDISRTGTLIKINGSPLKSGIYFIKVKLKDDSTRVIRGSKI
jgi:hypothetical protein